MNNRTAWRRLPALKTGTTAVLFLLAGYTLGTGVPACAQTTLLSNLDAPAPSPMDGTTISTTQHKTVAFTTGSTAYSLFSVQAMLSLNSSPGTAVLACNLYTPSAPGGSDPGTLAIGLGTQNVNNLISAPTVYTFTPSSAFVLAPATRYVLEFTWVSGLSGYWFANSPYVAPTARNGSGYSSTTYRYISNGSTSTSGSLNQFALNSTAVNGPEPGTFALLTLGVPVLGIGGVGSGMIARRRRAS